ncbi:MAG: hypothetical protein F2817_02705 [Actinobacteria bacterium]|nr:hypothetical protein [Actinomycetota bacterium]
MSAAARSAPSDFFVSAAPGDVRHWRGLADAGRGVAVARRGAAGLAVSLWVAGPDGGLLAADPQLLRWFSAVVAEHSG